MIRFRCLIFIGLIFCLAACNKKSGKTRPRDTWAFRSVLDKKPRMLTLALDTACYAAYDLEHCVLYKVWKGGVLMEGAPYTNKKNVEPTTWGTSYFSDSLQKFNWLVELNGKKDSSHIVSKGYVFKNNQIYLKYALILSSGDTVNIQERPEFVRNETGQPGFERLFTISGSPDGLTISLQSPDTTFRLNTKKETSLTSWYNPLPEQFAAKVEEQYDSRGRYWMEKSDCFTCHEPDKKTVGPSFQQIALKYENKKGEDQLVKKIQQGGSGVWGTAAMTPHPKLTDKEIKAMLEYILSFKASEKKENTASPAEKKTEIKNIKPGSGAPLEGVHPSFDVATIYKSDFKPKTGGLAFLPNGKLLVTTWDSVGGVYMLEGVETGDTNKIRVKRIASGLAEPLGITVVDGRIFVLQKPELTELIDRDGDDIIDEYRTVCNSWGISGDFHEFAFGLIYKDGYFYANLSLAMRLMSAEKQQRDRGRTIKISMDGKYEPINFGLRQPNGIGLGPDNQIFLLENQGEWVPSNKLIHVKKGEYHGQRWGVPDSVTVIPPVAQPAVWLPEDEIANSPSQPILMQEGPYKGQMLHGDVTQGGLDRDFLEKINGEYQGCVFRFTQGLEAGVNRLCRGPDGALYLGEIGMVGGWSWREKQYGLQRMKYNGKVTFEMLAVRAKPNGFEIEFTEPINPAQKISAADFLIQQWWYLPTQDYGGPKKDLENLKINKLIVSADKKRLYLEIPNLKKEHVVYFRLPDYLQSASGESLWSSETWYTLNNIPR